MVSIMNCTPILVLLLACVKFAAADVYYIGPTVGGVIGLIVLILDIIAIVEILRSAKGIGEKLLWILLIIFLPIIGLIVYLLLGRAGSRGL